MRPESCGMIEAVSVSREGKSYDIRFQERLRGSAPPCSLVARERSGSNNQTARGSFGKIFYRDSSARKIFFSPPVISLAPIVPIYQTLPRTFLP